MSKYYLPSHIFFRLLLMILICLETDGIFILNPQILNKMGKEQSISLQNTQTAISHLCGAEKTLSLYIVKTGENKCKMYLTTWMVK